jgi:hypothetical protein
VQESRWEAPTQNPTHDGKDNEYMNRRKPRSKALGLTFFAALALMVISAPGASATTGALLILNAAKNTLFELHAPFTGRVDVLGQLHVPAINLEIDCPAFTVEEGLYLATDHIGHAKLLFEECKIYQLSPLSEIGGGCDVFPSALDRTHLTNLGKIKATGLLLVLNHTGADGTKKVVRVKNLSAHLFFKNCPTGSLALILGAITLLSPTGGSGQHAVEHLLQEATGTFKLDQLLYGINNANILGSVWIKLAGAHEGLEWGLC